MVLLESPWATLVAWGSFCSTQTKKILTQNCRVCPWSLDEICLGFMMLGGVQPRSQPCKLVGCFFSARKQEVSLVSCSPSPMNKHHLISRSRPFGVTKTPPFLGWLDYDLVVKVRKIMAAMKETIGIAKHSKIPQEDVQPLMLLNRVPTFQTWVVGTLPRIPVTTSSRASQSKPSFATVTERGDNPNSTHLKDNKKKHLPNLLWEGYCFREASISYP